MKPNTYLDLTLLYYIATVILLTVLSYVMIYDGMLQASQLKSIELYDDLYSHVRGNVVKNPNGLKHLLSDHINDNVSYQIMLISPSGRPYVYQYSRPDQPNLNFFILPYWQNETHTRGYDVQFNQLLGYVDLGDNTHLYIQVFHPPVSIDGSRFLYWLPLLMAMALISLGILLSHRRHLDWQNLMDYMDELPKRIYEPYSPVHFNQIMHGQEFIRLGNALNRINYQLHYSHRRIQVLQTRLEHLVTQAPLPIFLIKRNGQISFFNKRFEKLFMTSFEESVNYYLSDFLMGGDKQTQVALANLDSERTSRILNVTSLEQNGTPYQLHLSPWFSKQGQVQGYCAILSEVTAFSKTITEARHKLAQQQEKLNEFDKLWSVLGHELRTPLSGILGMLELMEQDNFTVEQKETYATLEQTSKGMLTMLNDMLDVAKMEAGKLQVVNERTDLLELSKQLLDLMSGNARQQNIELLCHFDPQCPRYFTTDSGRLRQALLNLLSNAIKFTQSGYVALIISHHEGRSPFINSIAKHSHKAQLSQVESWICFTIKDTGIGISDQDMQKLFSHFNQANESISRQFGGTGLGLAISNNFAQLLGGFIHVDSEVGVGSTFNLCLPNTEISYQPLYQFNTDLSGLYLMAFTSQDISTQAFVELSNHLNLPATVHTGINKTCIDKINKQDKTGLKPIILVEYELYDTEDIDLLNELDITASTPKILLSMTPETAIFDNILEQYSAFLTKPLEVSQLITELIRLSSYNINDTTSVSRWRKHNASKVQQSFDNFMSNIQDAHESTFDDDNQSLKLLPNVTDTDDIKRQKALPSYDTNTPLILVAEDNKLNQKVVSKILGKLGYASIIAQNGQEALDYLDKRGDEIDLILMDCRMPIIDGLQATQKIRASKNTIPIVALTANDTDSDREECLQAGMNSFLAKPIREKALDRVLNKFIVK